MKVKATISPGYRWRLVLISVVMVGFGLYCVYDWQVGYPAAQAKYEKYIELRDANPESSGPQLWAQYAPTQGWSTKVPKEVTDKDIFTQLVMACIVLPIGVFFLGKLVVECRRWVAMDDQGVTASGGHTATWSQMTSLNKDRWRTKGIAYLHYERDNGGSRKILLDDFKSERSAIKAIVDAIDAHLNPVPDEQATEPDPGDTNPQPVAT